MFSFVDIVKFTPVGACCLVGVSAEFGTLGGKSLSSTLVGAFSLVGVLTEFGTWGGMLIGYDRYVHTYSR